MAGAGFATVYPHGTPQPLAASLNYAGGDIVNNAMIVRIPNPLSSNDMTIHTFAASHFVADHAGIRLPQLQLSRCAVDGAEPAEPHLHSRES